VEALESDDERWLIGVQCHPERTESSPPEFDALWRAFIAAAARGEAVVG
jgi:gamma-glutamyl-gamma-aminobutyrate hydrolase PuuD